MRTPATPGAKLALRVVTIVLFVTFPFACAVVAVAYAPPAHLEVAGQTVSVKPVLGQDTSRLLGGALVRPDHAHVDVIGKDIGVDVDADWNRLIPSDKRTRAYLTALWEDPTPQIGRIQDAARQHVLFWSGAGFLAGVVVVAGLWSGLAYRRHRLRGYPPEQADLVRRHNRRLRGVLAVVGTAALVAVDVVAVRVYLHDDHHTVVSSPVFAGTSLEGTEVNGLAAEVLPFLSILRPRSTFYDTVADNLERALVQRPSLRRSGDEVVLVLAEDFEDVNGMARQVGLAADLVDASFLALTGDLTFAGLEIETYIIDTVDYYSDHRPVYFAPGLHDTEVVLEAAAARGWHVADGETVDADGVSLLAAADPRITTVGDFGTGSVLRDPDVDVDQFVADTVEEACAEPPDLVILHDHLLGRRIAEAGCQESGGAGRPVLRVRRPAGRPRHVRQPHVRQPHVRFFGHRVHRRQHRRARHDRAGPREHQEPGPVRDPQRPARQRGRDVRRRHGRARHHGHGDPRDQYRRPLPGVRGHRRDRTRGGRRVRLPGRP